MAGETLLEKLVIEIGLDPADFDAGLRAFLASYQNAQQSINKTTQQIEKDLDKGITRIVSGIQKQKREEEKEEEKARRKEEKEAERKQREQERAEKKEIDERERRIKDMFSSLKKEALGFLGVYMSGRAAKEFLDYITVTDAATGRLSKTLGISTQDLTTWGRAAEMAGGTAQGMAGDMLKLANMKSEMVIAPSLGNRLPQIMSAIATAAGDHAPDARTMEINDILRWINHEMSKVSAPMPNKAFSLRQLGFSEDTISMLIGSPADLNRRLAQGAVTATSQRSADIAQKWQDASTTLTQALTKLGQIFVDDVLPPLTTIAAFLGRWLGGVAQEKEASLDRAPQTVTDMNRRRADRWQHRGGGGGATSGGTGSGVGGLTRNRETLPWPAGEVNPGTSSLPGTAGLDSLLVDKLSALRAALPPGMDFSITSGYRSSAEQARLYANRGSNPFPVAPPGSSRHETGMAADLRFASPETRAWVSAHAAEYGLHFPNSRDPIHIEPMTRMQGRPTGAEAAAAVSSTTFNRWGGDSATSTTVTNNIGDIHVAAPPGSDPSTFAGSIKFALDYRLATLGNYGQRP
jgi:hypothetical protein